MSGWSGQSLIFVRPMLLQQATRQRVPTLVAPGRPNTYSWDLAPDGKRVAVLTPVDSADAGKQEHEVVLLQNFFDELRRRVPLGK